MTTRPGLARATAKASPEGPQPFRRRLVSLSGVAFALLLLVGWFLSGGDTPDYTATDAAWTNWAETNRPGSGVGGTVILLAGVALLHYAGNVREVLGSAERTVPGSVQLARVAFAGAVVGITGIAMAIVMVGAATSAGAAADPVVSRAVTSAAAGPYLVAAMGFVVLLGSAGVATLRTRALPRWTGVTALLGAVAFLITFGTLAAGTAKDSWFGYGFLPGILAVVTWSIGTSLATSRAAGPRPVPFPEGQAHRAELSL